MKSLSLKTLVQLDCTFASLRERSLLRCKTLDQCLCLGAYFATIFNFCFFRGCFLYLFFFVFVFVLVSPRPAFEFQLVLVNRRRSHTQILWRLLWNGLEGFTRSLAALRKGCLKDALILLCVMFACWTGVVENVNVDARCKSAPRRQVL